MKTNQMMTVQIGSEHTVQIGHLTQMGSLSDVLKIGNEYRKEKGLLEIEMTEWFRKESTWEFIIKVFNEESKKSELGNLILDISAILSGFPRDDKNRIAFGEVLKSKKFESVIKSQNGGKVENRGYWANFLILIDLIKEFGLTFDVIHKELLQQYNEIKHCVSGNIVNIKKPSEKVYVLTDGFFYKIGSATNVKSRINKLQSGNPHQIQEVFSHSVSDSLKLEKSLHKKYAEKRMSGEWFNLTEQDLKEIESLILESV